MKTEIVARFDGEKAAEYCNNQLERVLKGSFGDPTFWSNLAGAFEAGLVPHEQESKKNTIEIDRAVAEEWADKFKRFDVDPAIYDRDVYNEIKKALGRAV